MLECVYSEYVVEIQSLAARSGKAHAHEPMSKSTSSVSTIRRKDAARLGCLRFHFSSFLPFMFRTLRAGED